MKAVIKDTVMVNVPIHIEQKGLYNNVVIETNKIATVYGKENINNYINKELKKGNIVKIKRRNINSNGPSPIDGVKESVSSNNNISQTTNNDNGKKQSGDSGMFSLPVYQYDGETAKSRGIRSQAVNGLADSLAGMFGITDRAGKEGLRNAADNIAEQVEKFGFITKADMNNFFDSAYRAARFTDEKADYAPLKKRIFYYVD
ncbi:MAG: hypothetical protein IKU54_05230 [Oscillospiraceae bacterium]|nr:hypothetical protein [Oscillospiraceae bacterium]